MWSVTVILLCENVCVCEREKLTWGGGNNDVHLHSWIDKPYGQMGPPLHTHARTHPTYIYPYSVERGSTAGPLRAEPRSHSLRGGREKRRDRGSEQGRVLGWKCVRIETDRKTVRERGGERENQHCVWERGWRITAIPSCFGETNLVHLSIVELFYVVVVERDGPLLQHAHWAWATSGV